MTQDEMKALSTGSNYFGQLGNGTKYRQLLPKKILNIEAKFKKVVCGYNFTLLLDEDGKVFSTGDNSLGQLGIGKHVLNVLNPTHLKNLENFRIVRISGGKHSAAIDKKGELFVWGMSFLGSNFLPKKVKEGNIRKNQFIHNFLKIKNILNYLTKRFFFHKLSNWRQLWYCAIFIK